MKVRYFVGIIFLGIQFLSIVYSRFIPERFFCWAPYDEQIFYEVKASNSERFLTKYELEKRYHRNVEGWEQRSIYNLFNIIEQYESTYGKKDSLHIEVKYSKNGHKEKKWLYKND